MRFWLHTTLACLLLLLCSRGVQGVSNALVMCNDDSDDVCENLVDGLEDLGTAYFDSITIFSDATGNPTSDDIDNASAIFLAFTSDTGDCGGRFTSAVQNDMDSGRYMVFLEGMEDDCQDGILTWLNGHVTSTVSVGALDGGGDECEQDSTPSEAPCLPEEPNELEDDLLPEVCDEFSVLEGLDASEVFLESDNGLVLMGALRPDNAGDAYIVVGSENIDWSPGGAQDTLENIVSFLVFDCCDDTANAPLFPSAPSGTVIVGSTSTTIGSCCGVDTYDVTATDADVPPCDPLTVSLSGPSSGTCMITGDTVTATATDSAGRTATATWTYDVDDVINPTANCPGQMDLFTDPNLCEAEVTFTLPASTDNCAIDTTVATPESGFIVTLNQDIATDSPFTFTVVATDTNSNTAACDFQVTVTDNQPPSITCNGNTIAQTDTGSCSSTSVEFPLIEVSDNCIVTETLFTSGSPAAPISESDSFPFGITTVTATVGDTIFETSCDFEVTVTDGEAPTGSCEDVSSPADSDSCFKAGVVYSNPNEADNCDLNPTVEHDIEETATFPVGDTVVTRTITDSSGLIFECQFTVTINDLEDPTITCPSEQSVVMDTDACTVTGLPLPNPILTDNCLGTLTVAESPSASGTYGPDDVLMTYTVTDSGMNTASCTFTYSFRDAQAPTFDSCPADYSVPVDTQFNYVVSAVDNCDGVVVPSKVSGVDPTDSSPVAGSFPVVWEAFDSSGFRAECSFVITVLQAVLQPVEDQYVMMYLPVTIETSSSVVFSDTDTSIHWELLPIGGGAVVYQSEEVAIASLWTTDGAHKAEPGQYEFWIETSSGRRIGGPTIFLCSSPYINFPAGCHI